MTLPLPRESLVTHYTQPFPKDYVAAHLVSELEASHAALVDALEQSLIWLNQIIREVGEKESNPKLIQARDAVIAALA